MVPIVRGQDTIIQCRSGAGATTAMVVGLLQRVDINIAGCQALFLCSSRECASAIHGLIRSLGEFTQVLYAARRSVVGLCVRRLFLFFCFLIHRSQSISFTRAQGIPKCKIGFGRGKGWESWGKIG